MIPGDHIQAAKLQVDALNHADRGGAGWIFVILLVAALASCGTVTDKKCDIQCPNGVDKSDPSGCTCIARGDAGADAADGGG